MFALALAPESPRNAADQTIPLWRGRNALHLTLYVYLVGTTQLGLDGNNILILIDLDDSVDLCSIAHQFHGTRIHHSL